MLSSIFEIEFNPHKHLVHWDRINALVQGKDTSPVTLELDVSSICNHKCGWCVDPPPCSFSPVNACATSSKNNGRSKGIGR